MIYKAFDKHHSGFSFFLSRSKKMLLHGEIYQYSFFFFFCEKREKQRQGCLFNRLVISLNCCSLHPDVLYYRTPCIMHAICYLLCHSSDTRHEANFPNKIHERIRSKKANYLTNSCSYQRLSCRFLIYFFYIKQPE